MLATFSGCPPALWRSFNPSWSPSLLLPTLSPSPALTRAQARWSDWIMQLVDRLPPLVSVSVDVFHHMPGFHRCHGRKFDEFSGDPVREAAVRIIAALSGLNLLES